jgi:hypothetical protein
MSPLGRFSIRATVLLDTLARLAGPSWLKHGQRRAPWRMAATSESAVDVASGQQEWAFIQKSARVMRFITSPR